MSVLTPFQTVGPFFDFALCSPGVERTAIRETIGPSITIEGRVLDGGHQPVPDALVEIWQADGAGRYPPGSENGFGFARCGTDESGRFSFVTIVPGQALGPSGPQAPHVLVGVLARGIMTRLVTRIYFQGEPANAEDEILRLVPETRRHTLIAQRVNPARYHFPIVLQGERETVFFDV